MSQEHNVESAAMQLFEEFKALFMASSTSLLPRIAGDIQACYKLLEYYSRLFVHCKDLVEKGINSTSKLPKYE